MCHSHEDDVFDYSSKARVQTNVTSTTRVQQSSSSFQNEQDGNAEAESLFTEEELNTKVADEKQKIDSAIMNLQKENNNDNARLDIFTNKIYFKKIEFKIYQQS